MTQTIINKNFAAYADIERQTIRSDFRRQIKWTKSKAAIKQIRRHQNRLEYNHNKLMDVLTEGQCFGYSVNYVAHHYFNKRIWWKHLLHSVAIWNKRPSLLRRTIVLPDASPVRPSEKKQNLFKNHIERAMNYVIPVQSESVLSVIPETITQSNMLSPTAISLDEAGNKKSYFEYLHDGIVYSIKKEKKLANTFSKELLVKVFEDVTQEKFLGLVHNKDHTIGFGRITESTWFVYDPNYNHQDPSLIEITGTIEEIAVEIIRIMGTEICLHFASFDPECHFTFPFYEAFQKKNRIAMLAGYGIFVASSYSPDQLIVWLEEESQSSEKSEQIIDNCKNLFTHPWKEINALKSMLFDDEKILAILLKMGKESYHYNVMRNNLLEALFKKDEKGNPVLVTLIENAPKNLLLMMDFLIIDNDSLLCMIDLLSDLNCKNQPIWTHLDGFAAMQKIKLIHFFIQKMTGIDCHFHMHISKFNQKASFPKVFLEALMLKLSVKGVDHALEVIFKKTPEVLPSIVKMILAVPDGLELLIDAFHTRRYYSKQNNWEKLQGYSSEKNKIMELLAEHIGQMNETTLKKWQATLPVNVKQSTSEWMLDRRKTRAISLNAFLHQKVADALLRLASKVVPREMRKRKSGMI